VLKSRIRSPLLRFLPLFILALFGSDAFALDYGGTVTVRGSRDPAVGLSVVAVPKDLGDGVAPAAPVPSRAETDRDGRFTLTDLNPGAYRLILQGAGFVRQESSLVLNAVPVGARLTVEREERVDFETTIVTQTDRDPSKREISLKTAARQPGAGTDPLRAVQNLPGVNRTAGFGSQVVIQGSAPRDTVYTIDSHEIPLIFHFGGLTSVLTPELTEGFDYLSAGYQANYGRALGGVINLRTKQWTPESPRRLRGSAFVDTFNAGAAVETGVGEKSRFALGGRISYIGTVLKAIAGDNSDDFSLTAAPTYRDLSFLYETPLSDNARFRLFGIASNDSLGFVIRDSSRDPLFRGNLDSTLGFFRLIPSVTWRHSSVSESQISLGLGRDFVFTSIGDQYFNLRSTAISVRAENRRHWNADWMQSFGMDHRFVWSDVSLRIPETFSQGGVGNPLSGGETQILDLKAVQSHQIGIYSQATWHEPGSRWTVAPALRFDSFTDNHAHHLSPRLTTRYELTPADQLIAGGGLYYQPAEPQETAPVYGNPDLKSPRAIHARLGYERDLSADVSRGSSLYAGVFSRWFDDLVAPDVNTYYSNSQTGRAYGFETQLKYQAAPWDAALIYTLSRSTRSLPGRGDYLAAYDQTHLLTAIAGVDLPRRWRLSARFRYVTGPVRTPVTGGVADLDNDVTFPIRGGFYSQRLQPFSMLDVRVDKKWVYDTWSLTLYLDIINFLNHRNVESIQYAYDYRSSTVAEGIPILPTFGLRGDF
jgi:hypothetical protein